MLLPSTLKLLDDWKPQIEIAEGFLFERLRFIYEWWTLIDRSTADIVPMSILTTLMSAKINNIVRNRSKYFSGKNWVSAELQNDLGKVGFLTEYGATLKKFHRLHFSSPGVSESNWFGWPRCSETNWEAARALVSKVAPCHQDSQKQSKSELVKGGRGTLYTDSPVFAVVKVWYLWWLIDHGISS